MEEDVVKVVAAKKGSPSYSATRPVCPKVAVLMIFEDCL